jgi:hypothetical protein
LLQGISSFADKACACHDAACARRVVDQMTSWSAQLARHGAYTSNPSDAQIERNTEISTRISTCFHRLARRTNPDDPRH